MKGALKNNRTCRREKGPARHEEIWCWGDETYKNVSEKRRLSGVKKRRTNWKKYLDVKKSDGKTVYHAKRETERNRFASASRRDNQKCEVFKMATWMVIIKSSVFDV